ncbi:hypothetical protein OSTOST_25067 [Ostertagia ostertagi]
MRYFYNLRYHRRGSNVAFLMLGGAGVQEIMWVHREEFPLPCACWAKEKGALIFALEHRFYGKSRPTNHMFVKDLRLLNSRQAIEDIATFVEKMNEKHKLKHPRPARSTDHRKHRIRLRGS